MSGGPSSSSTAKPVKGRRGTLYHLSPIKEEKEKGIAITTTLDDVKLRRRFATNRYFLSPAGLLKLLVIILFLVAGILFISLEESCPGREGWYTWLYPVACLVAFLSTAVLYAMFMLGMAEDNPRFWVTLDMSVTLMEAAAMIAISIVTITESKCTSDMGSTVMGPLGLAGAALMAISCAATYIMWRHRSQDAPTEDTTTTTAKVEAHQKSRKSIFI